MKRIGIQLNASDLDWAKQLIDQFKRGEGRGSGSHKKYGGWSKRWVQFGLTDKEQAQMRRNYHDHIAS